MPAEAEVKEAPAAPAAAAKARILVIANQKGGVGKTTTAINLGTALAAVGEKVLLIDSDPQGNASTGLGVGRAKRKTTLYDVLMGEKPATEAVVATDLPGLYLIPADPDLSGVELELGGQSRRSFKLRDALDRIRREGDFTYVLIDCPPSLNLLTVNAMTAADAVLVPLQCEFFALEGLTQLMRTVELVRGSLNPALEIQGVVLTMYDRRNSLSEQVARDVRDHFGETVYETMIPRNVRVSEAPSFGKPVLVYDLKCAGSQAYLKLAREVVARERRRRAKAAA
ncbi:ParA family protein [Phenylobacterium sp.]|uniref:ParA family protein n=1 Tax=Phenylobacterium sp. TaxID=1871053 RepID=UPI0008CBB8FF|nr:AAA family ATPase [Phenylobacterium sp.]MBA4795524.1 ParA family protein [Phenylobacterium sp.]OHB34802.1 MAG: chromosome partitioning protein ParA [Phenylobacterium sp. RIFCSPHIGHO2_01_FULL_70_10]